MNVPIHNTPQTCIGIELGLLWKKSRLAAVGYQMFPEPLGVMWRLAIACSAFQQYRSPNILPTLKTLIGIP